VVAQLHAIPERVITSRVVTDRVKGVGNKRSELVESAI
jgi:hypothetical protein